MHKKIVSKIKKWFPKSRALHFGVASVIALFCVVSIMYLYHDEITVARGVHDIKLTEQGFTPSMITITKGDTIVFTTTRSKPFWPASDLHPTHTVYPEFDPRHPIEASQSWTFRFDKAGEWEFHDHLDSYYRGTIIVQDEGEKFVPKATASNCSGERDGGRKVRCWEALLLSTLQEKGVDSAYQIVADKYATDEDFRSNCHGFTHTMGKAAYEKFRNNESQGIGGISSKTSYCSYGFYHGFMEALLHNEGGGSVGKVREFCNNLSKELTGTTTISSFWTHCLHGIGHGFTDASDPRTWGSVDAIIKPGLALCEKVAVDAYEKQLCGSGVFNSLFGGIYENPMYRLSPDKKNPQAVCYTQAKSYFKAGCYNESITFIMNITGNNVRESARFIEHMAEQEYRAGAIDELETYAVKFNFGGESYSERIALCHSLQEDLHAPCIAGIAAGFMEWGTPEKEDIQALAICNSSLITTNEKHACFERLLWLSSLRYSLGKQKAICASVGVRYRQHCPEKL